jgi:hypothetical protein
MKRLALLGLVLGSLGLAACAVGVGDAGDGSQQVDEQQDELGTLGAGANVPGDDGLGDDGAGNGQVGTARGVRPNDINYGGADPSGPTPHPWQDCDDPNGGPTPHPWGTSGTGSNSNDPDTDTNGAQGTSAGVH